MSPSPHTPSCPRLRLAVFLLPLLTTAPSHAGGAFSSLEQFNFQTGHSNTTVNRYEAFDELDSLPDVTGYTLAVNAGDAEIILKNPEFGDTFKRRLSWGRLAEMLAERPIGATYTHTLTGTPAGTVVIESPNIAYAAAIPANPVFTISGVNGIWRVNPYSPDGQAVFQFDPSTVTNFTVTMNAYAVPGEVDGDFSISALSITDVGVPEPSLGNVGVIEGELLTPLQTHKIISATFIVGAPADGGDSDPNTFGIAAGNLHELEGEFVNVFGLQQAGAGDLASHQKAFVYQNVTGLAILPGTLPLLPLDFPGFINDASLNPQTTGAPNHDADGDGLQNAIEWVVGGFPGTVDSDKLPSSAFVTADPDGDSTENTYLLFTYRRSAVAAVNSATEIAVSYGSDLSNTGNWVPASHGVDGVVVVESPNAIEIGIDEVRVYIPTSQSQNDKLFARLNVTIGEETAESPVFDAGSGDFGIVLAGRFGTFVDGVLEGEVIIQETLNVDFNWNGVMLKANLLDIYEGDTLVQLQVSARAQDGSVYVLQREETGEGVETYIPPLLLLPAFPYVGMTWTNQENNETREMEVISANATSPGGITGCVAISETNPNDWREVLYFKDRRFVGNTRVDLSGNNNPDEAFFLQN